MIEILWHGRGGQGAFTAARLLGAAASLDDGRHALAFPSFGPERRGAPMRAFTKLSDEPIGDRSAVAKADYVIYLDDTLLGEGWETELKPGGVVLVNSVRMFDDERIAALDADGISAAVLGRPIPNTVFLGALSALCDRVSVENVQEAIRQYMPAKLHAKNIAIVDAAREAMGEAQEPREEAPGHPERAQHEDEGSRATPAESASSLTARTGSLDDAVSPRPASRIPVLRSANLDPADFAHLLRCRLPYGEERRVAQPAPRDRRGVVHRLPPVLPPLPRRHRVQGSVGLPADGTGRRCGFPRHPISRRCRRLAYRSIP